MASHGTIRHLDDEFTITEILGKGGAGYVARAHHKLLRRDVALKILPGSLEPKQVRRFFKEARRTARLDHPHIVQVYDFGVIRGGRPCLVMSYVRGRSLQQHLDAAPLRALDSCRVASIAQQVCDALHYAHAQGIIHRDIKPANLLITPGVGASGEFVRVVDFGVAMDIITGNNTTQIGRTSGTPEYMSPAQCQGARAADSDDIYALGVTMYQALTGQRPFRRRDIMGTMLAHSEDRPAPVHAICPEVPRELSEIVMAAMAFDPRDRPSSAGAMGARLGDFLSDSKQNLLTVAARERSSESGLTSGTAPTLDPPPASPPVSPPMSPSPSPSPPPSSRALIRPRTAAGGLVHHRPGGSSRSPDTPESKQRTKGERRSSEGPVSQAIIATEPPADPAKRAHKVKRSRWVWGVTIAAFVLLAAAAALIVLKYDLKDDRRQRADPWASLASEIDRAPAPSLRAEVARPTVRPTARPAPYTQLGGVLTQLPRLVGLGPEIDSLRRDLGADLRWGTSLKAAQAALGGWTYRVDSDLGATLKRRWGEKSAPPDAMYADLQLVFGARGLSMVYVRFYNHVTESDVQAALVAAFGQPNEERTGAGVTMRQYIWRRGGAVVVHRTFCRTTCWTGIRVGRTLGDTQ